MRQSRAQAVAAGLGFFSIGLGLAELIAPRLVRQAMGLRCSDSVVRLYGAREIATGIGILIAWKRAPWVWARVAGAPPPRRFDYSNRSGFPRPAQEMRGAARTKKERAQGPLSFETTTRV